eukprot:gnl/TRDRNA2_/TRDRNA2_29714_c0_seq1.p1 gnl/TRDRNA2_/TRDRNA2_29714_c0~~gnl/TRDRNA2_/TRDRNA2_29714_c0_seq1.p1  ORF type:complete len:426 (-),score=101.31 gnl/TRDRNA2_/TRDRNA2_29714_c0_seq1:75-1352(-)
MATEAHASGAVGAAHSTEASSPKRKEDLQFVRRVGRGHFGEVWEAKERAGEGRVFAVKRMRHAFLQKSRCVDQVSREIQILYSLRHPRIVRLYFDFTDDRAVYLCLEFVAGGSLFDRLNKAGRFSAEVAARYFLDTCDALDYLHHLKPEKVIHRDVKPENILLDSENRAKLADFGWSNKLLQNRQRDTFCGTLDYLAPEMVRYQGHDESVDMWTMGVLLYELTTGRSPFGASTKEVTCRLILAADLRFPTGIDPDAVTLIKALCRIHGRDRLTARQAKSHRFIAKFEGLVRNAEVSGGGADAGASEDDGTFLAERPSVTGRRLAEQRERLRVDVKLLLQAKQQTDDVLLNVTQELEEMHEALRSEQRRGAEAEAACVELEKASLAGEKELAELQRTATALRLEAERLSSGGFWRANKAGPFSTPV